MPGGLEAAIVASITEVDEESWDRCAGAVPLLRHGFFRALENSGAVGGESGLIPRYVTLRDRAGQIAACAPVMLKWGNKREFGPEIRWLRAGLEAGCFVWPKAQVCTPFFPRMAPKLLVSPDAPRGTKDDLLSALRGLAATPDGRSAFNLMHLSADDARYCAAAGALISREYRSAWHNPGVATVDEYLRMLPKRSRNKWLRERRQVDALGLRCDVIAAPDIDDGLLADFYRGFEAVCARHGNRPWIPLETFRQLCRQIPESVFLMTARARDRYVGDRYVGDRYVAGAFRFVGGSTLYNDTWSAPEPPPPGLLATMACHLPIEYAITHGLTTIDAGLAAPHKTYRGYVTEPVYNAHWFSNERLAALAREALAQDSSE